jgi:lauroyl/myristoyl acyltransferase
MSEITAKPAHFWEFLTQTPGRILHSFSVDSLIEWLVLKVVTDNKSAVIPRVRKNIALVTQLPEDDPRLEIHLKGIYRNLLYNYLEFFKATIQGPDKLVACVDLDHRMVQQIYKALADGSGVILAGVHCFGYDICMRVMHEFLPSIQILSKTHPVRGEKLMHWLRKINRIKVTPLSVSSLRDAVARLKSGGIVAIAIDMPIRSDEPFVFFDSNALLTNAHTRLAVQTGAKIFLFYSHRVGNDKYRIEFQEVQQPEHCRTRKELISCWAQKTYQQVEPCIRQWPDAWYGFTFELFPREEILSECSESIL